MKLQGFECEQNRAAAEHLREISGESFPFLQLPQFVADTKANDEALEPTEIRNSPT